MSLRSLKPEAGGRRASGAYLLLEVDVVVQVAQAPLVEAGGHLLDVAAQVAEQLRVAVAGPEAQLGLAGQVHRVEDVLVPEERRGQSGLLRLLKSSWLMLSVDALVVLIQYKHNPFKIKAHLCKAL